MLRFHNRTRFNLSSSAILLLLTLGCGQSPTSEPSTTQPILDPIVRPSVFGSMGKPPTNAVPDHRPSSSRPKVRFVDRATELSVEFTYQNGARGQQLMVEATGGGVGWLDYDRDGWPDLYLGQGGSPLERPGPDQPRDELFRNRFGLHFENVTDTVGIDERGYGQGVCAGDFDNDGFDDLLVTNVGTSRLFSNCGDGTFRDVTAATQLRENHWSTSAAWGDIDRDGDLDLYICRYCQYDPRHPKPCRDKEGRPSICHPKDVSPEPDEIYINQGDGTFRPAARELGLFGDGNRGLGVVIADFNNDHWPDIFVANDTTANFLFLNQGGSKFVEEAVLRGCAVSGDGIPQANMGIACGDYDRNGYLDLYVTHFTNESNTLYANFGSQGFSDQTALKGLVVPTLPMLAFGTAFHDFNGDGWLELFVANGHINERRTEGTGYAQRPQLFSYNGRVWDDISLSAGPAFDLPVVGRGVAGADFDRDGRIDLACVPQNSPFQLLHNQSDGPKVLSIECIGRKSSRQAIGTRVTATVDDVSQYAELFGSGSYCSSQELVLNFGFGGAATVVDLKVIWPGGIVQSLSNVAVPQRLRLLEPDASDVTTNLTTSALLP